MRIEGEAGTTLKVVLFGGGRRRRRRGGERRGRRRHFLSPRTHSHTQKPRAVAHFCHCVTGRSLRRPCCVCSFSHGTRGEEKRRGSNATALLRERTKSTRPPPRHYGRHGRRRPPGARARVRAARRGRPRDRQPAPDGVRGSGRSRRRSRRERLAPPHVRRFGDAAAAEVGQVQSRNSTQPLLPRDRGPRSGL